MASLFKNQQGIALLITIAITTVLIAATLELNRQVRTTVEATATTRDRLTLSHVAASGINVGMAMLIKDKKGDPQSGLDSVQEDWADPEKISEVLQDIPFEKGNVKLKISDEMGRIQINALVDKFPGGQQFNDDQYNMWDNLLRPIVSKDEDADINATTTIINSVKDWMDSKDDDGITGLNGAESDHYQGLDPPYECRNGPIPRIEELLMIKGMPLELFSDAEDAPGLSDYMTVYGVSEAASKTKTRKNKTFTYSGKININTADLPVLKAITGSFNEECAQAIYDYRVESDDTGEQKIYLNNLSGKTWYKDVTGCGDVNISSEIITHSSDIFRIESTGTLHDATMTITAVVKREKTKKTNKWMCRVLSWREE